MSASLHKPILGGGAASSPLCAHSPIFQLVSLGSGQSWGITSQWDLIKVDPILQKKLCHPFSYAHKKLCFLANILEMHLWEGAWCRSAWSWNNSLKVQGRDLQRDLCLGPGWSWEGGWTCRGLAGTTHSPRWEKALKKKLGLWKLWSVQSGEETG